MLVTLPVLMALSWIPASPAAQISDPAPTPQESRRSAETAETITCPLTGEQIPACCCPVRK